MADTQQFQQFIAKLKEEKSKVEVDRFMDNLLKFSAAELYMTIMLYLTDEDMDAIEKIEDDTVAEQELTARFKNRTGKTPEEFVKNIRESIAAAHVEPTPAADTPVQPVEQPQPVESPIAEEKAAVKPEVADEKVDEAEIEVDKAIEEIAKAFRAQ